MLNVVLSPSSLKTYQQCPYKWKCQYIDKSLPYVQSHAAQRGEQLHAAMEKMINEGWKKGEWPDPLTENVAHGFVASIEKLKTAGWEVKTELEAAISADGECKGWWDKVADGGFLRSRIDVCAVHPRHDHVIVCDWKTGKRYDADKIQLATNAMCLYPYTHKTKYQLMFAYLDLGEVADYSCAIPAIPYDMYKSVHWPEYPDVKVVYDTIEELKASCKYNAWPTTPNKFCHWCGVEGCSYSK